MDIPGLHISRELKLEALLKGIDEGIIVVGRRQKVLWANSVMESWAGRSGLTGLSCFELLQSCDSLTDGCPCIKAFETEQVEKAGLRTYTLARGKMHIELTASPIIDKNGAVAAVAVIARDLTRYIELDNRLKESKERLETVFDAIGDGISTIDGSFNVHRVNRGILEIFRKKEYRDVVGGKCYALYSGEDKPCDDCPAEATFESGVRGHLTKVWRKKGGERIVFDIHTFPIKDPEGKVAQVIEYFRDITGMIKLEDQLLRYERLAGAGEVAMGIAHELRNPLGNISASVQLCLSRFVVDDKVKKHLKVVRRNTENANRIVKDLLDFARPDEIALKPGRVESVIKRACSLAGSRFTKQRVKLYKKWTKGLPPVMINEKFLEAAFLNFILNALDAMHERGSLIIAAYTEQDGAEVTVTFTDTGDGISETDISRIFDPFFTTKKSGVGLGLSVAHHIIIHHNGRVQIKSEAGKGTEVIVTLPAWSSQI
ncbi:MAG: PAS domain-containing protein [Deltaproteobacteria bacterium]|nr:PAS domain-containing protein [Deltaproteobacteria bacterium]